jgi:SAM-dependent methyltransferase
MPDRAATIRSQARSVGRPRDTNLPVGMHLVGSVPLGSAEEVFRAVSEVVGTRLRRLPDGETGPRGDWIVWQYPVLSSRPEFEVAPPAPDAYRHLPRLRFRDGADRDGLAFGSLGYAAAARSSYREFARLKLDGVVPSGCRFQVSLPTPLAPMSAFVCDGDRLAVERAYEARLLEELDEIVDAIPAGQLAIQWCTGFDVVERLLRLSRDVPAGVDLGVHLCRGDSQCGPHHPEDGFRRLVELANGFAACLDRPLNWVHLPVGRDLSALRDLRLGPETELYLGFVDPEDGVEGAVRRIEAAREVSPLDFGVATECGWGRRPARQVGELLRLHARLCRPVSNGTHAKPFAWPAGFDRVPDEEWTRAPLDTFGVRYDSVEAHGWYRNLDPTVDRLATLLRDGDVLVDYSGGTGILLNRLRLRVFDRQVGMLIADSSPKFLRVAVEHFREDPRVGFRLLRYLDAEKRLQFIDEVLEARVDVDVLVSTNAIHLYTNLDDTLASWARILRPGGRVLVNSGNVRNPSAGKNEWILDETVYVVHEVAVGIVRTNPRYAAYRAALDDEERLERHLEFRDRVFVPPRTLTFYLDSFERAGFEIASVGQRTIMATVDDWFDLLTAYNESVLGWVGGSEKIDGAPPSEEAIKDRLALIRESLDVIFGGRPDFRCCWTYLEARRV